MREVHKLSTTVTRGRTSSADSAMCSRLRYPSLDRARSLVPAESTLSAARPPSFVSSEDDEPPTEYTITRAVNHMLEQHHIYNEHDPCTFIANYHPNIPDAFRRMFVLTAAAAAKYVASVHMMADTYKSSPDPMKVKSVDGAKESLVATFGACHYSFRATSSTEFTYFERHR